MNCIYEDPSRKVWGAYIGNRLACISPDSKMLQTYLLLDAPSPKVYDIQEGDNERLFITTYEHFLWKVSTHKDFIHRHKCFLRQTLVFRAIDTSV